MYFQTLEITETKVLLNLGSKNNFDSVCINEGVNREKKDSEKNSSRMKVQLITNNFSVFMIKVMIL